MRQLKHFRANALWVGTVLIAATLAGCGERPEVAVIAPRRSAIEESFTEPARTRLANSYRITMPIDGRIARIDIEPGDPISVGQELVAFDRLPYEQHVTEARATVQEIKASLRLNAYDALERTVAVEAQATIDATRETVKAARSQVDAERARSDRASIELERIRKLRAEKTVAQSQLDDAELLAATSMIELRKQEFYLAASNAIFTAIKLGPRYIEEWLGRKSIQRDELVARLGQAQARLARAEHDLSLASVTAPISGVVLKKYQLGDDSLAAGEPLLEIGSLTELEVIAEVLTPDAMSLAEGASVALEPAVGMATLAGRVKRIEPAGFTKLSSLGVEQQRVNVIVALDEIPPGLGVGYRLEARFFTGSHQDTLVIPRPAVLQAPDQSFYVFKVQGGELVRQTVTVGLRSDLELEILDGLTGEDTVLAIPNATLREGDGVRPVER